MGGVHEVWARVLWAKIDAAERAGVPLAPLFEGLPFDAVSVRRMGRVAWEHLCEVVERIEAQFANLEEFDRFVVSAYNQVLTDFHAIGRELGSPKETMQVLTEEVHPLLVPPIAFRYEDLGGDRMRISQLLREGARPCLTYFRWKVAGHRCFTHHFGLPSAEVRADPSPTGVVMDITYPPWPAAPSAPAPTTARRNGLITLGYGSDGQAVFTSIGCETGDADQDVRVEDVTRAYHLTPRQADVLSLLVQGLGNKEIAQNLGCVENTVEAHVTQLLRKLGVESRMLLISRFWAGQYRAERPSSRRVK